MLEVLFKSGFCFFRQIDEKRVELENKFTGLRLIWDAENCTKTVKEGAV